MGFLSDVVGAVRRDLERNPLDEARLTARALSMPPARGFARALRSARLPAFVPEFKRATPTAGRIAEAEPRALTRAFQTAGAAAVSVLTERRHFDGSLADLRAVHLAVRLPVLRKDFLVHPAQLMEARAEGADAALLIAACLSPSELSAMLAASRDLGMDAQVETHSEEDLEKVLVSEPELIGVNARDLETLEVDEERALGLMRRIPSDRTVVFEGGIARREQVERAVEAGATAILVGETLMRAANPGAKLRQLRGDLVAVDGGEDS